MKTASLRTCLFSALLSALLAACTPSLDWREVRPAGAGAQLLFPCKPELNERPATAAAPAAMGLAHCEAAGLSFSLAWAELADPTLVTPALARMREALAGKLAASPGAATSSAPVPVQVRGMTPNPQALTQALAGGAQQGHVAVFSRGRKVYQALMLGAQRNEAAWESFAGSIRLDETP
ncbi:MAG: hypothetical protein ABW005_00270 [Burkholderiaceae bacterium]